MHLWQLAPTERPTTTSMHQCVSCRQSVQGTVKGNSEFFSTASWARYFYIWLQLMSFRGNLVTWQCQAGLAYMHTIKQFPSLQQVVKSRDGMV
jgi:hypothetical protein